MEKHYYLQQKTRLDQLAVIQYPNLSRSKLQKLIKKGFVTLDGMVCTNPSQKIPSNTRLILQEPITESPTHLVPYDITLHIIFEDQYLLIINKQPGLVVHPAPGHKQDTLVNALISYARYHEINHKKELFKPMLVHRLDKDTSGILIVAKTEFTFQKLKEQLINHSMKRSYYAFVWRVPSSIIGTIDAPIGRNPIHRKKMSVISKGKQAITHYQIKKTFGSKISWLECRLETGRTHQIRVHLSYQGNPLVGDHMYGGNRLFNLTRQALHAYKIQFVHPITNQHMIYEAPLPDDLQYFYQMLELTYGIQ